MELLQVLGICDISIDFYVKFARDTKMPPVFSKINSKTKKKDVKLTRNLYIKTISLWKVATLSIYLNPIKTLSIYLLHILA